MDAHANFSISRVATAPSPATSGTSLTVTTGDGARFPTPAPFNATVWPQGAVPTALNTEIVRVTAVSTDTFTITRTQEGTSARSIIVGDQIAAMITKKMLTDIEQAAGAVAQGRAVYGGNTSYVSPGVSITATSSVAASANVIYYHLQTLDTEVTLDQFTFLVTVGPASDALVRLGIYAADTNWQPTGAPLVDAEVAVATAFTGAKTSTISVVLPPGRYLLAQMVNVVMTFRTWRGWPASGLIAANLGTGGCAHGGWQAQTYGAMPTPTPTAWTNWWASGDHMALVRISVP